ncbi:hypothetical protein CCP3SC15_300017 [Gammaproteobacteria bacterium]
MNKPFVKICTVFYNEWQQDPVTGIITPNDPALPIEESIAALRSDAFTWQWRRARATYIHKGRNSLINLGQKNRLEQIPPETFTHYLFIDSDVHGFEYGQIDRLLNYNLPIVSGAYLERKNQECFCAGRFPKPPKDQGEFTPATSTGLKNVDWVGAGFLLIKREIFERLKYPWFRFGEVYYTDDTKRRCILEEPEDLTFCRKARAAGYSIYLDCDCRIEHALINKPIQKEGTMSKSNQPAQTNDQPQQIAIEQIPTNNLKALAFDMIAQRDQLNNNLTQINAELMNRARAPQPAAAPAQGIPAEGQDAPAQNKKSPKAKK